MINKKLQLGLFLVFIIFIFSGWKSHDSTEHAWEQLLENIHKKYSDVEHITTDDLSIWLKSADKASPILLDIRSKEEYQVSHLWNARNIESKRNIKEVLEGVGKTTPIVVYCSVGERSSAMARKLQKQGYTNVLNLEGSIFTWVNEGRNVYRNTQMVQEVHPYNKYWGQFLDKKYHAETIRKGWF